MTWFLPAALMVIMFGMGIGLVPRDFRRVVERPRGVGVGLLGQLVLLPLVGFGLVRMFGLSPTNAVGTILLCACPGGATSNLFSKLGHGDVALSVTLTGVSGLVTVFTIPLLTNLGIDAFGGEEVTVALPVVATILKIATVVVLPVGVGMAVRRRLGSDSGALQRLERRITRVSVFLLAVIIIGAVAKEGPRVARSIGEVGAVMVLLSLSTMAAGFVMARAARLARHEALTIAIEVGMQNGALAIGIALTMPNGTALAVPAIVYGLWAYTPCALASWWGRRTIPYRSAA